MKVTSENYVDLCLRTESPVTDEMIQRISRPEIIRLLHGLMGLQTESAEMTDALKKHIFYGKPLDLINVSEEVGDCGWYISVIIDVLRTTYSEIMTTNIEKLKARYPEKFTSENAITRNLDLERSILEGKKETKDCSNCEATGVCGL